MTGSRAALIDGSERLLSPSYVGTISYPLPGLLEQGGRSDEEYKTHRTEWHARVGECAVPKEVQALGQRLVYVPRGHHNGAVRWGIASNAELGWSGLRWSGTGSVASEMGWLTGTVAEGAHSRDVHGPPPSFHRDFADQWGAWVLDHGLPELPSVLGDDDEVPIAFWAGERLGVVLCRNWADRSQDEDWTVADDDREVDTDHYCWIRSAGGWQSVGTGGGTAGTTREPMAAPDVPDDLAMIVGEWVDGGAGVSIGGLTVLVGKRAKYIDLVDRHGVTRRPVEAPVGQAVVCFDADDDVIVRILDADEKVLRETRRRPGY